MLFNKKYTPQKNTTTPLTGKEKRYFPYFLPAYQKPNSDKVAEMIRMALQYAKANNQEVHYLPCIIKNASSERMFQLIGERKGLSVVGKYQRLIQQKAKIEKKYTSLYANIFNAPEVEIFNFNWNLPEVQKIFQQFEDVGLRKYDHQLVWWDIASQTIVAPEQIVWKEEKGVQLEVKCFVETKNDVFPLVVDDPLLLFSDLGVLVHENDKRYKKHVGKNIIIPLINKSIPVIGVSEIDTIKNNGIERLNPYLDPEIFEKVKAYGLFVDEEYIDAKGCFTDKVENFGGKPVFEFKENIIETLATIGNLVDKKQILKQVPYSAETGQRLIKRLLPTLTLDFDLLSEEQKDKITHHFQVVDGVVPLFQDIQIESKNPYAPKIAFLVDAKRNIKLLDTTTLNFKTVLESFIFEQFRNGLLQEVFSLEELIDVFYLFLGQEKAFEEMHLRAPGLREAFNVLKKLIPLGDEKMLEERKKQMDAIAWLEPVPRRSFKIKEEVLFGEKKLISFACHDRFVQAIALLMIKLPIKLYVSDFFPAFLSVLKLGAFLEGNKSLHWESGLKNGSTTLLPERLMSEVSRHDRGLIKLLVAQGEKYTAEAIEDLEAYQKHLRNICKLLYEQKAFESVLTGGEKLGAKESRLLAQWNTLADELAGEGENNDNFKDAFSKLQAFTRGPFSRYLALIKGEEDSLAVVFAATLYLEMLALLQPYLPEFVATIERQIKRKVYDVALVEYHPSKDYKVNLLFDIIQSISQKKQALEIKKHIPLMFAIQANPDILALVEKHKNNLTSLFKIEEFHYLNRNEEFPEDFEIIMILDIKLGIKPYALHQEEDALTTLESEYREKQQQIEFVRSTLVALSLNPLSDSERVTTKEKELEQLKEDLQKLEVEIQKLKFQKKS